MCLLAVFDEALEEEGDDHVDMMKVAVLKEALCLHGLQSPDAWTKKTLKIMQAVDKVSTYAEQPSDMDGDKVGKQKFSVWLSSELSPSLSGFQNRLDESKKRMQDELEKGIVKACEKVSEGLRVGTRESWKTSLETAASWDQIYKAAAPMLEPSFAKNLLGAYESLSTDRAGSVLQRGRVSRAKLQKESEDGYGGWPRFVAIYRARGLAGCQQLGTRRQCVRSSLMCVSECVTGLFCLASRATKLKKTFRGVRRGIGPLFVERCTTGAPIGNGHKRIM